MDFFVVELDSSVQPLVVELAGFVVFFVVELGGFVHPSVVELGDLVGFSVVELGGLVRPSVVEPVGLVDFSVVELGLTGCSGVVVRGLVDSSIVEVGGLVRSSVDIDHIHVVQGGLVVEAMQPALAGQSHTCSRALNCNPSGHDCTTFLPLSHI